MAKKNKKNTPKNNPVNIRERIVIRQASVVRKDIADWKVAKQYATRVDFPKYDKLQELFSYCMVDAHLHSQTLLRKAQALQAEWSLLSSSGNPDQKATDHLRQQPYVRDIISLILDSIFYGYSVIELNPQNDTLEVSLVDRRHIDPVNGFCYIDTSDEKGIPYRELSEYGTYLLEFNAHNLGLLDQAVPHVLYKRFAQACWSEFCEICGMPPRFIKTNTQDQDLRRQYEEMLRNVGSGANYVIDTDDEIGFADTNSSNGEIYEALIRLCSNEISLLINGAVIGQDTKFGSNSKEETSSNLNDEIVSSDMVLIENTMTHTVLPALSSLGIVPQGLRFKYSEQEDTSELFQQTIQAAAFFDIDPAWVKDKFGIEVTGLRSTTSEQLSHNDGLDFFA